MRIGSAVASRYRQLRWRIWRPSRRRYVLHRWGVGLKRWWYSTWFFLGFLAAAAAFLADKVGGEASIIVICVAMILIVRDFDANKKMSILTAVLGLLAAYLALPAQSKSNALDLGLLIIFGALVGASAFVMLVFTWIFDSTKTPKRRRRSKSRRRNPSS